MKSDESMAPQLREWLESLRSGEQAAEEHLVTYAQERFRALAHRMLRGDFARVGRFAETSDVLQGGLIRLWKALRSQVPDDLLSFRRLVALQLRRELIDLSRKHFGPQGIGANHHSAGAASDHPLADGAASATNDPQQLAQLTELHEMVERLPAKLKDVFDLRFYHDMTIDDIAEELDVATSTVKLRYQQAVSHLWTDLGGKTRPGS
ncbi:MAG: sigma-70 family RNA polymerase sigma factor [Pirellulales bacterium]